MTDEPDEVLAQRFEEYLLGGLDRLKSRGYNPTRFSQLVRERGGAVTAIQRDAGMPLPASSHVRWHQEQVFQGVPLSA